MIKFAGTSNQKEFILGTEIGLIYPISRTYPDKRFYPGYFMKQPEWRVKQ
jgi:quinolinate synthase